MLHSFTVTQFWTPWLKTIRGSFSFAFAQRFYPADMTQAVKLPRARMDATLPDCV